MPNLEPPDVVVLPDGGEALVTSTRVEAEGGQLAAPLEVAALRAGPGACDTGQVALSSVSGRLGTQHPPLMQPLRFDALR